MRSLRLSRIPKRLIEDLKIITTTKNWQQLLIRKLTRRRNLIIECRNGVVMSAPDEIDLDFLFHEIWIDEFYTPKGYKIEQDFVVVDIGANVGVFSLFAATQAPGVTVRSFEPFPMNAKFFVSNVTSSKLENIEFRQVAVCGKAEKRTLEVSEYWILHRLAESSEPAKGIEVDCITLEEALEELETCDLLKLDCEGSEYEILYNAPVRTLTKISRIVCEFNEVDMKARNGRSLSDYLERHGFVVDGLLMLGSDCGRITAYR